MKRLVIKKGNQIIRHEIGVEPVTFGRDPSCSFSFDDPALSRRHGSFEPTAGGVRFTDLGSRNGSWVNFKKAKEADLKPGDTVRMGSLLITYAYEEEPRPAPAPAPVEDPADDTATVVLSKPERPAAPPTPPLPPESIPKPPPPERPTEDKTVLLDRKKPAATPGGTMLLRPEEPKPKAVADTGRLPESALRPPSPPPPEPRVAAPPPERRAVEAPAPSPLDALSWMSWTAKYALVAFGVGLVLYLVLAFPLVRTLGNALREESLRRGRVLLDLLATANAVAVGEGRARDLDVSTITREERVKEALLLDLQGKVLAPSSRVDETVATIPGIQLPTEEIRTFYLGRRSNGDYVFVEPLVYQGRRVGVAVLVYESATPSGSLSVAVLFLGFLVLLLGVAVSIVLGKRFTLEPIASLRDDVEAVVKGDAPDVPAAQGFAELSEIANSINRLIDRAPALAPVSPAPPVAVPAPQTAQHRSATPPPLAAPAAAAGETGGAARFWCDSGFLVVRAEPAAAEILGSSPESLEGRHVIEAVKDQKLLGVVLDALNSLESGPGAPVVAELATGNVSVTAAREGAGDSWIVVSLKPVG